MITLEVEFIKIQKINNPKKFLENKLKETRHLKI
jgi:hypothetical protein